MVNKATVASWTVGAVIVLGVIATIVYFTVFRHTQAQPAESSTTLTLTPTIGETTLTLSAVWTTTSRQSAVPRPLTSSVGSGTARPVPGPGPVPVEQLPPIPASQALKLRQVFDTGAPYITDITSLNDGTNRVWLACKNGKVFVGDPRKGNFTEFLSIDVNGGSEAGLLGMAPHPQFSTNRFFALKYANPANKIIIARGTANADATKADRSSVQQLLSIDHLGGPPHHYGGNIRFGPDGLLYILIGDTTDGNKSQDKNALQGKVLRIGVGTGAAASMTIPSDNPRGTAVLHYGLRNPYAIDFSKNGTMWVGIVGNDKEMLHKFAPGEKDKNLGWPDRECGPNECSGELKSAAFAWNRGQYGSAMIGGCLYEGSVYSALKDCYIFAGFEFGSGENGIFAWSSTSGNSVKKVTSANGAVGRISSHVDGSVLIGVRGKLFVLE